MKAHYKEDNSNKVQRAHIFFYLRHTCKVKELLLLCALAMTRPKKWFLDEDDDKGIVLKIVP